MIHTWTNLQYSDKLSDRLFSILKKPVIKYYSILQKPLNPILDILYKIDEDLINEIKVLKIFLPHDYSFFYIPKKIEFASILGNLPADLVKKHLERDFSEQLLAEICITKTDYKSLEQYKTISNNTLTTLHYFTFLANRYATEEDILPYPKEVVEHILALSPEKKINNLHPWSLPTVRDSVVQKNIDPVIENLKHTEADKINKMVDLLLLLRMLV